MTHDPTPDFIVMHPDPIERARLAIEDIRAGRMVTLVDDEDRENEGDLTIAAEMITPEAINFMATHGRGLICLTMTADRVDRLGLPMMSVNNQSPYHTAFTVSIEAREGVTTGISAADRAHTVLTAIDPSNGPQDLVVPGHIFPLRARDGGVLVRTGQTEGSVDLARLAGLNASGVICEIMSPDGTMARLPELIEFGKTHGIRIVAVADLIQWRLQNERLIERVRDARLPIPGLGEFNCRIYRGLPTGGLHLALWKGEIKNPGLVRVQAADPIGDVFRSGSSKKARQLEASVAQIAKEGGVFLYMNAFGSRTEDDLLRMFSHHLLPAEGEAPTPPARQSADARSRDLGTGCQILRDLGVSELRLLTNNQQAIPALDGYGLTVIEHVPIDLDQGTGGFLTNERLSAALGEG